MLSISFESPDFGVIGFTFKKFDNTFKIFFLHLKNPPCISVDLVRVPFLTGIIVVR